MWIWMANFISTASLEKRSVFSFRGFSSVLWLSPYPCYNLLLHLFVDSLLCVSIALLKPM